MNYGTLCMSILLKCEKRNLIKIEKLLNKYSAYAGISIKKRSHKGYTEIYQSRLVDGKRMTSFLKKKDHYIYYGAVNYRFFNALAKIIRRNIDALETAIDKYQHYDIDNILKEIPATYREMTKTMKDFLPEEDKEAWRKSLLDKKKRYPPQNPEGLIHETMDGTMVRSKSEMIIYNMLYALGYTFVYEAPYITEAGDVLHPDFTIYKRGGRGFLLVEHDGGYLKSFKRAKTHQKMEQYYLDGLRFYEDVIFTFDRHNETINAKRILELIEICLN